MRSCKVKFGVKYKFGHRLGTENKGCWVYLARSRIQALSYLAFFALEFVSGEYYLTYKSGN